MKYSIIIPTLNEEKLLPHLLDQIDDEELKNKYCYEIIVSDGGSSDSTKEIALKRADKLTVHDGEYRQNISEGRNKGAFVADGDWLIFLNGDVLISDVDDFFNLIDTVSSTNKYVAITYSVEVRENESRFSDKIFLGFYNYFFHFLNIIGLGMGRGECMVIPREKFELVEGFNQSLAAGEDFDLYKRLRSMGRVYFSHSVIIYESPRRYRKYGHFRIMITWLLNSLYVILTKKSRSTEWEEVR